MRLITQEEVFFVAGGNEGTTCPVGDNGIPECERVVIKGSPEDMAKSITDESSAWLQRLA